MILLILMAAILTFQELNTNSNNLKNEKILAAERNKRDSLISSGIRKGVDSASQKLFEDISKAFAKQEFKLDTLNNTIINIKDSTLIQKNLSQPDPVLIIKQFDISVTDTFINDKYYSVKFTSADAGSTNFNIDCFILIVFSDNTSKISIWELFPKNLKIPKDISWESGFRTTYKKDTEDVFIYITGTYTTIDGNKSYSIDDLYDFNLKTKITKIMMGKAKMGKIKIIRNTPVANFD